jgi:hypothetical protein
MELELPEVSPTPVAGREISSESGRRVFHGSEPGGDLSAPFDLRTRSHSTPPAASRRAEWPALGSPRQGSYRLLEVRRSWTAYLLPLAIVGVLALGALIWSKAVLHWLLITLVCIGGLALIAALSNRALRFRRRHVGPQRILPIVTPTDRLKGRVSVGMKERSLLPGSDELDKATQAWLRSRPSERFHLVRIVCIFEPYVNEVIEAAEVNVALTTDGQGVDTASVWSLTPQTVALGASLKRTASFGADLKLINASVSKQEDRSPRVTVRGMGELQRWARWKLDGTDEAGLTGDQEFHIVVACPKAAVVECQLSVQFRLNWSSRRRTYLAELPEEIRTIELARPVSSSR